MLYAVSTVYVLTGALLVWVGVMIGWRGRTDWIAGYDPKQVRDERGLARWVGGCVGAMGGLFAAAGLGAWAVSSRLAELTVLLGALVLGLTVAAVVGARRFMNRPSGEAS